ncbi:hypothetical protein M0R45_027712 [Rubus argutus]|uniref:SEC63 domain-containing protein n=1 Tax=Rubus argutus TaxID=59490 RepID=A0AAW1X1D9_RUBAR
MKYLNAGSGKEHLLLPYIAGLSDEVLKRTLCNGVGYLHEGSTRLRKNCIRAFEGGEIQVCVMSSSICWGKPFSAYLVVVMGTQYDDVPESMSQYADFPVHLPTDYHVTDLIEMIGHAGRAQVDDVGKCLILCHVHGKAQYVPSLSEALVVESTLHIENNLNDFLNAGVVAGRIRYNTSFYNHENLISVDDDEDRGLSPSSLGKAACDNYISLVSIEYSGPCLSPEREIEVAIRPGKEEGGSKVNCQPEIFQGAEGIDPGLLHVIIDVISSYGYLELALQAMSVCQMVTQGLWTQDSYLLLYQLPHFTKEAAEKFENDLRGAFDFNVFVEMDNVDRRKELKFADCGWMTLQMYATDFLISVSHHKLRASDVELKFAAPASGKKNYVLYFISDSYMGLDQEEQVSL